MKLTDEQKVVLAMYCGMFALEFASSMGHTFNKEQAERVDLKERDFLVNTFDDLTSV